MKFPGALDHATLNFLNSFFFDREYVCVLCTLNIASSQVFWKKQCKECTTLEKGSMDKMVSLVFQVHYCLFFFFALLSCTPFVENIYFLIGCCFVLCLDAQSCPTRCDPIDCSLPGSFVRGILQARILEWVAMPSSRGSSQPWDQTQVSHTASRFFTVWATREALIDYL